MEVRGISGEMQIETKCVLYPPFCILYSPKQQNYYNIGFDSRHFQLIAPAQLKEYIATLKKWYLRVWGISGEM